METKIRQFMKETFLFDFDEHITEETDLFKEGIMDSFGYIQLMKFLEKEFNIEFSEEEMLSNVVVSFSKIVNSVSRKIGSKTNNQLAES